MSKLLDVVNDISSHIVLECTQGHIVNIQYHALAIGINTKGIISYKKGERHSRNCIFLNPGKWKIAAKKYQLKSTLPKALSTSKTPA